MTDQAESKVREWAKKRNGDPLTSADVVELVLAVDADGDARHDESIAAITQLHKDLQRHLTEDVRMTNGEFKEFIGGFQRMHDERDALVHDARLDLKRLEDDIAAMKQNCAALHPTKPNRWSDPPGSDYAEKRGLEDEEVSDMRRAWRTLRWLVIVIVAALIVMFADQIGNIIFGGPT